MTYFATPKKEQGTNKNIIVFNLVLISAAVLTLSFFLVEYDSLVGKDYELGRYQDSISYQQSLIQKQEIKLTEKQSISNLRASVKDLNLVAVDKVEYLKSPQTSMALSGQIIR